jgi:predicted secreted acid phosphatase
MLIKFNTSCISRAYYNSNKLDLGLQLSQNKGKLCLVLDLDETLVSAVESKVSFRDNKDYNALQFNAKFTYYGENCSFKVTKRPGSQTLLSIDNYFYYYFLI